MLSCCHRGLTQMQASHYTCCLIYEAINTSNCGTIFEQQSTSAGADAGVTSRSSDSVSMRVQHDSTKQSCKAVRFSVAATSLSLVPLKAGTTEEKWLTTLKTASATWAAHSSSWTSSDALPCAHRTACHSPALSGNVADASPWPQDCDDPILNSRASDRQTKTGLH